ncbi:MAG: methionyl-tRNA formyltransferase [Schwartzia succinivorans]|nr:methionyl-tRNA formyltransferase [Schwartzia succinivorans]
MLRLGYFGDGAWATKALLKIEANPAFSVAFIVLRYRMPDKELGALAQKLKIPCFCVPDVNASDFLDTIRAFSVDINVSMSFDQILKSAIIQLAPKGFINCHAGALPFYRGRNILNWALINGEKQFGVTVHYVDEGIDTGDIILQRFAPILREDRYGDLLNKASDLCAETLYDALVQIDEGQVQAIPQKAIHPVGFYCSARKDGDELIDWAWDSERIYNFVRGIAEPAPGARTFCAGKEYIVDRVALIENAPNYLDTSGNIVGKSESGITVKTGDSTILITRLLTVERQKVELSMFRMGQRFKRERVEPA